MRLFWIVSPTSRIEKSERPINQNRDAGKGGRFVSPCHRLATSAMTNESYEDYYEEVRE